jgi:HEAT repeat protein
VNPSWNKTGGSALSDAVLLAIGNQPRPERERAIASAAETADPEQLVGLISTEDAIRRNAAMEALGRAGRRSVPALVKALEDPDPEVVMFAATTLGKTRDLSATPHLARVLRHGDANVCHAAIESLGCLRAVSALDALASLLDGDPWLRFAVVHTLGEIGDPSSIPTLVGLLDDADLRDSAIAALGKIGGPVAVGELARRLETSQTAADFTVWLEAIGNALVEVPDPAVLQEQPFWTAFVERAHRSVAPRLAELLAADAPAGASPADAHKEAAVELVRCLRLEACYPLLIALAGDDRLHESLLFAAADLGPALAAYLVPAVRHPDPRVRRFVCGALAAIAPPGGAAALVPLLHDPDEAIRAACLRVLARLHHAEALREITASLRDESAVVRAAAREALSRMDGRLVTLALLRDAQERGEPQRELLASTLAIMQANPHPLQRGLVEASLADPSAEVRQAAVLALAAQRAADVAESLEAMLADVSPMVRRSVVAALVERPSERTRRLLMERLERDGDLRGEIITALGRIGDPRAVPRIVSVFRSCSPADQISAVDALGLIDSPSAQPFLCRQLGNRDPRVRRHAVRALVHIGSPTVLRRVALAARDANPRVRLALSKALASCPHPTARRTLERLSVDPDAAVATAALG